MDLLLIARKVWRYKLVSLPIIALTIAGGVYVLTVKQPLYEATSSYLLINPPAPPTPEQIARDPALGRINPDNPYTRFGDQAVVIDVLTRSMTSESAREALVKAGADPRYTVGSGAQFGSSSPIVQITGTGSTPEAAMRTAEVVGHAVVGELARMQEAHHVDRRYRITTLHVEVPEGAQLRASGQMRMLIAVIALGAIVLFVVVSIFDALAALVWQRRAAQHQPVWGPDDLAPLGSELYSAPVVRANGRREGLPSTSFEHPG